MDSVVDIMKHVCLLFAFELVLLSHAEGKEINMLFMGNSFTFRHNLPELVKTVIEEGRPELKVRVEMITYGGQDLFRHHDLYFSQSMVRLNSITIPEIEKQILRIQSLAAMKTAPYFYSAYWKKAGLTLVPWDKIKGNLKRAVLQQKKVINRIKSGGRLKWDYLVL